MQILDNEFEGYTGESGNIVNLPEDNKSLYNHIVVDSEIEQNFARQLQQNEDIKVFCKLPDSFTIDTPIGSYNPDWAYVRREGDKNNVYFVTETKGRPEGENTPKEEFKIACGKMHFKAIDSEIEYRVMKDLD